MGRYAAKFPYPIDQNIIPHIDDFTENGYTKEEMKMVNETHKILGDNTIGVTATTARVPVIGGHSESVNLEFEKDFELDDVRRFWKTRRASLSGIILPRRFTRCLSTRWAMMMFS